MNKCNQNMILHENLLKLEPGGTYSIYKNTVYI